MKEIIVEIKNDQGVHARPSGQIVNIAKKYDVALEIEKVFENEQAENNKEEKEKKGGVGEEIGHEDNFPDPQECACS